MAVSELRIFIKQFSIPIGIICFVIVAGSVGFYSLWRPYNGTWLDAIYMTFITITTIGFREVHPIEGIGRVLTVSVALTGIGSLFYLFTAVMEFFVAQQLRDPYGRKVMQKHIETLKNHTIVAGFGRMGHRIADELRQQGSPFVVIDREEDSEAFCFEEGYTCVIGDAEEDEVLERAGIKHARALIAATGNDAANAFIVMGARALNPNLFIVARAGDDATMRKLQKAGANQTINLYAIAGQRLVNMVVRPAAVDFISQTLQSSSQLNIHDFLVRAESSLVGKSIKTLDLRNRTGVSIIAVLRNEQNIPNPSPEFVIEANDLLITLGSSEQFMSFTTLAEGVLA